jgi:hypothetical protein
VFLNTDAALETVAEIIDVSQDGRIPVYTDSATGNIGFIDIDDPAGLVRIGRYSPKTGAWGFYHYPLDEVESPAGGWIGLSEITPLGHDRFAVIERDNQRGLDARVKRLYTFSLKGLNPVAQGGSFPVLSKTLARDILPDLQAPKGWVQDKPEGLAVSADGEVYLVTDNDGVDDSTGETQFLHLGSAKKVFGN